MATIDYDVRRRVASLEGRMTTLGQVGSDGAATDVVVARLGAAVLYDETLINAIVSRLANDERLISALTTRLASDESLIASLTTRITTDEAAITALQKGKKDK